MDALLKLGKYFFAIPFLAFGGMHMMAADQMAGMVPIPGGAIWVYITGLAMIAAAISILIGKMDKLAAFLLGILLIIYVVTIHMKGALAGEQSAMSAMLKDIVMAGGAWVYGAFAAKDNAVIG